MTRTQSVGACSTCNAHFEYALIHNGFNESAYAYCELCGATALLSGWAQDIPSAANLTLHTRIAESVEPFLARCECGGRFMARAVPRCPRCRHELSAERVREFLEANASGASQGWRWQGSWDGLYCIIIEQRLFRDPWVRRQLIDAPEA